MSVNTILFDLDGTLADTLPLIRKTFSQVFREMHLPWGDDDVMKLIGIPLLEIGRKMAGLGREKEFFQIYQKHYRIFHEDYVSTFPGVKEMLCQLNNRSLSLGLVTSKSKIGADLTLSSINLSQYFSIMVTANDTDNHKPHPEPVLYALKGLDKSPREAVFIGDSPYDIIAGNQAGVQTIAVTWGMASEDDLRDHKPTFIVDTREELLGIILSLT